MATLIITIRNEQLEFIDPARGLYLFGISNVNENIINESTYQLSNRFDDLVAGLYHWYVKERFTQIIRASGSAIVKDSKLMSDCYTKYVDNLNTVSIPLTEHKKELINDVECFRKVGDKFIKFQPDDSKLELNGTVTVITYKPFSGKITIC